MSKINIMLDDTRLINPGWAGKRLLATTPYEFYSLVIHNTGNIDCVTFDHDLGHLAFGGKEVTGYHCLSRFVETYKFLEIPLPYIGIESSNPAGVKQMENLLMYEGMEFKFPYRYYIKRPLSNISDKNDEGI